MGVGGSTFGELSVLPAFHTVVYKHLGLSRGALAYTCCPNVIKNVSLSKMPYGKMSLSKEKKPMIFKNKRDMLYCYILILSQPFYYFLNF